MRQRTRQRASDILYVCPVRNSSLGGEGLKTSSPGVSKLTAYTRRQPPVMRRMRHCYSSVQNQKKSRRNRLLQKQSVARVSQHGCNATKNDKKNNATGGASQQSRYKYMHVTTKTSRTEAPRTDTMDLPTKSCYSSVRRESLYHDAVQFW